MLEAFPAASNQTLTLFDEAGIEMLLAKIVVEMDRGKFGIDDELAERGVAGDVPLVRGVQSFGIDHAKDISQVQIALPDVLDIFAADFAEVAFFAMHGEFGQVKMVSG